MSVIPHKEEGHLTLLGNTQRNKALTQQFGFSYDTFGYCYPHFQILEKEMTIGNLLFFVNENCCPQLINLHAK